MKSKILFFIKGPGSVLTCVLIAIAVAWEIKKGNDNKAAAQNAIAPKKDIEHVKKDPPKTDGKAPEIVDISKRTLPPVGAQPLPNPTISIPVQRREAPKLAMFYTASVESTPSPAPIIKRHPAIWLPPFVMMGCGLVNTVESSNIATPIIGELLHDVLDAKQQHVIFPAGTVMCCMTASSVRDRIRADGEWVAVFKSGPLKGRQLHFQAIALDRVADPSKQQFGIEDGTGGLEGQLIQGDHWANAKAFLNMLLIAGFGTVQTGAQALLQQSHTALQPQAPDMQGVVADQLRQMWDGKQGDSQFIRVSSGSEFYVFNIDRIYPEDASIDGPEKREAPLPQETEAQVIERKVLQEFEKTNENPNNNQRHF